MLIVSFAERRLDEDGEVDNGRCYNTSVLIGPDGSMISSYRKIHLFDVDVPGGLCVKESDTIAPGGEIVVAETELGNIGMSICYDLRFPNYFRHKSVVAHRFWRFLLPLRDNGQRPLACSSSSARLKMARTYARRSMGYT